MRGSAAACGSARMVAAVDNARVLMILPVVIAVLLGSGSGTSAQTSPALQAAAASAQVLAFERQVEEAVLRADVAFLDDVCASDFTYTHGDGWTTGGPILGVDTKSEWLASLPGRYASREVDTQHVEIHGDVAITMGRVRARTGTSAAQRAFSFWYLRVYAYRDGRWRYLSHRTVHGPVYDE